MTMLTKDKVITQLRAMNQRQNDALKAVKSILSDVCEDYGTEACQEGVCDCDPNGWEGCLTRKILNVLEAEG